MWFVRKRDFTTYKKSELGDSFSKVKNTEAAKAKLRTYTSRMWLKPDSVLLMFEKTYCIFKEDQTEKEAVISFFSGVVIFR